MKVMVIDVVVKDPSGNVVKALSRENCQPVQLNAILALCENLFTCEITFREVDSGSAQSATKM